MSTKHPLRRWREEMTLSALQLGLLIGVDKTAVFSYESGRRTPRPQIMARIEAVTARVVTASHFLPGANGVDLPFPGVSPAVAAPGLSAGPSGSAEFTQAAE